MSKNQEISGIRCHVENCTYHAMNDCCEAGCIEVGCSDGCTCSCDSDTACRTFKAKEI